MAKAGPSKTGPSSVPGACLPTVEDDREGQGGWAGAAMAFVRRCGLLPAAVPPAQYGRAVTPAEWNTMVAALFGAPAGEAKDPNDPRFQVWMYTGGLARGEAIEREWAVGGLIKLLSVHGEVDLSNIPGSFDGQQLGRFRDEKAVGDMNHGLWAVAVSLGLVEGYPDRSLRAGQPLTVAEAAALLRRTREWLLRVEKPEVVLDLPLGPEPGVPGVTSSRLGGMSPAGPLSFAVGEGEIHVLDSTRGRILQYRNNKQLVRIVDVPFLTGEAPGSLLFDGGLLYVRDGQLEYEIDRDGRILRVGLAGKGTIYPRPRELPGPTGNDKALDFQGHLLGMDQAGNRYVLALTNARGWMVRRLDGAGRETGRAVAPPGNVVDWYVTPEGGVHALTWDWGEGTIVRADVYRVLSAPAPQAGPAGGQGSGVAAQSPVALGYEPPRAVRVRTPGWLSVEVADPVFIHNLWLLLSLMKADSPAVTPLPEEGTAFTVTALLPGGEEREFVLDDKGVLQGAIRHWGLTTEAARGLVAGALFTPTYLIHAIALGPVSVAVTDLPGVSRELNLEERSSLMEALAGSFRAGRYEPPQPLPEEPFPRYALRMGLPGNEATVSLAGERYLYLHGGAVALAHRGEVTRLVRQWLPVPDARPDELAYLYRATSLTVSQGGQPEDLTRWKATVVRALLLGNDREGYVMTYPEDEPMLLTFTVEGKPHVVRVTRDGFTQAGHMYRRRGLIQQISPLRGVP